MFEFLLIIANIATAVVLYPIAKRHSQSGALGYVTARIMESVFIMVGLLSLVSIVALRQDVSGSSSAEIAALEATGRSLAAVYEFAFLFRPGLVVGVGNGLILGWLVYSSGLVPRRLAMLGLIGGPSLIVAFILLLFGGGRDRFRGAVRVLAAGDGVGGGASHLCHLERVQAVCDHI